VTTPRDRLTGLSPEQKRALLERLVQERDGKARFFPMSFSQQRLWFLQKLAPLSVGYNVEAVIPLGPLDLASFRQAVHALVERHEVLRTTYREIGDKPVQVVAPKVDVEIALVDLSPRSGPNQELELNRLLIEGARTPFDLEHGPILRCTVVRLAPAKHLFVLRMHHIAADGWSMGIFGRDLAECYRAACVGETARLPELPIQYSDFAVWQRQWLSGERLKEQLGYWLEQLRDAPDLDLPTDRLRPARQSFRGAFLGFSIPRALTDALHTLAAREGCTLFMLLLAAFDLLLYRHCGQRDLVVGTYIANRERAEVENLVGFFLNTLVLRVRLDPAASFLELLHHVRAVALGAYSHQDLPFEMLVEHLRPRRDLSRNPIFQVSFQLNNSPTQGLAEDPTSTLDFKRGASIFDLAFMTFETEAGLAGHFEYATDLFDAETIAGLAEQYQCLLQAIVAAPQASLDALDLLEPTRIQALLERWNDTGTEPLGEVGLVSLFREESAARPDEVAFRCASATLRYGELDRLSDALAARLVELGVSPGSVVAILMPRSLEVPVAVLGILKAGCAWLALDHASPTDRLVWMVGDAQARALVTDGPAPAAAFALPWASTRTEARGDAPRMASVPLDATAYVVYTSGSTGRPKGIAATHRSVLNRLFWMWDRHPFERGEVLAHKTSLAFVDSVWEILGGLLAGVPTVILPDAVARDPYRLVRVLAEERVTRLWLVPSLLRSILESTPELHRELPHLRFWVASGESLPSSLVRAFRAAHADAQLYNLYGTSEVWDATWHLAGEQDLHRERVSIGRPIDNVRAYVVDEALRPLPPLVPGQLLIGGDGVMKGYIGAAAPANDRLVVLPGTTERCHCTGDRARWRPDGSIEHMGRLDAQLKIRGVRIEPAEIELALEGHPSIRQAAVARHTWGEDDEVLAAFVVAREDQPTPTLRELRQFLARSLPEPMLPTVVTAVDALPHTTSGKLDRRALQALSLTAPRDTPFVAPAVGLERAVARIWAEVLGRSEVGALDHFFADLGGHSLLATQVVARVRQRLGADVSLATLFEAPVLRSFCERVQEVGAQVEAERLPDDADRGSPAGLDAVFEPATLRDLAEVLP
jgi:amino acid adenylation domain-containing protein